MLEFVLRDHGLVNYIPIEFTKNLHAEILKEESQTYVGKDFAYNPAASASNTIGNDNTDKVKLFVQNGIEKELRINSPITESDFAGILNDIVTIVQDEDFININFYKEGVWDVLPLFPNDLTQKIKTVLGNQFLILYDNTFNTFNDDTNTWTPNYGNYYILIEPIYIETTITEIKVKDYIEYGTDLVAAASTSSRHTQYTLDIAPFRNTKLFFERSFNGSTNEAIFSNRLMGSVVYAKNSNGTDKNVKAISSDYFDFNNNLAKITMTPDYMGIDSPFNTIGVGDKLRIYPKECYFKPIGIKVQYTHETNALDLMRQYSLNDAVRDLQTNIIEVYDDAGLTINPDGGIDGRVIFSYIISQEGTKEVKRRI